jgi:hypothetical protein
MPTWGNIKDLTKPEFNTLPIIYSASFFNDMSNSWSVGFEEKWSFEYFYQYFQMMM